MKQKEKTFKKVFKGDKANARKFADKLQKEGKLDVSIWEIPDYREVLPVHNDKHDFAVIWTEILAQQGFVAHQRKESKVLL